MYVSYRCSALGQRKLFKDAVLHGHVKCQQLTISRVLHPIHNLHAVFIHVFIQVDTQKQPLPCLEPFLWPESRTAPLMDSALRCCANVLFSQTVLVMGACWKGIVKLPTSLMQSSQGAPNPGSQAALGRGLSSSCASGQVQGFEDGAAGGEWHRAAAPTEARRPNQ